jgi:asparagine synthase (glutamine-hydrolysing)
VTGDQQLTATPEKEARMCGIAGIVVRKNSLDPEQVVKEMTSRVRHRGPDDEGFCVRGRVVFGHRRLSIIDLSAAGHQPMAYADGRYVITYNGEIYNYVELRSELQALGFRFRSNTDTEVILAAYVAWGRACLARFNGMWAFALHDRDENLVFAARDRFGVKPFHYVVTERCFAFGSEIRQLLPLLPSVGANSTKVLNFLLTGVHAQSPETCFEQVHNLLPGHWLAYDVEADRCTIGRYYALSERVNGVETVPEADAIRQFRAGFEDAVRLRLRSDVRVGTCLSGGLDSSSVALVAAQMYKAGSNRPFSAITAVSEDPRNSEEAYAREVVEAGSLDWVRTRPTYEDFCGLLGHVVKHQEEPFGSPSVCMQAFVMRAARENGVVVLLDGQGGDETLLGYDRYYPAYCVSLWRDGGARSVLQGVRGAMRSNANMQPWRFAAYVVFVLAPAARYLYYRQRNSFLAAPPPLPDWISQFASASRRDIRALQVLEVETVGLPSLLRYEDKNSMAFSVEARLPFLDYRLVEKAIALAPRLKMRDGWTKWMLRQAMSDLLPPQIAWRRNKIGFEAPTEMWLARHIEVMTEQIRGSALLSRLCDADRLMRRFRGLDRNTQWRLYSLALWEETFGVEA